MRRKPTEAQRRRAEERKLRKRAPAVGHQRKRAEVFVAGLPLEEKLHARIVCYVRTGTRRWRFQWHELCRELGLECAKIEDFGDGFETAFDVWCSPWALQALTSGENKVLNRWHVMMVPGREVRPAGSGECPKRSRDPILPTEMFNGADADLRPIR